MAYSKNTKCWESISCGYVAMNVPTNRQNTEVRDLGSGGGWVYGEAE